MAPGVTSEQRWPQFYHCGAEGLKHGYCGYVIEPRDDWEFPLRMVTLGKVDYVRLVAAAWRSRMFVKSAASSAGTYTKQSDLGGLLAVLWQLLELSAWPACRTLASPGVWVMLSRHPALYDLIKMRLRGRVHG